MRIRAIKPEFWRSDDINEMSIEDRLLFIGLWSYVDDNGVGVDRVSNVTADLFAHDLSVSPHDTLMRVQDGLNRLHTTGQITRYKVGKKSFLHITNWDKHQKINRPSPGRYPLPSQGNPVDPEPFSEDSLRTHEDSLPGTGEQGNRGTGEREQGKTLSRKTGASDPDFDAFWDVYDKKHGKKLAQQRFKIALRKPGVTPERLIQAASDYIAWQTREGKHPTYTKDPASWLNGEHWNDERSTAPVVPISKPSTTDTRVSEAMALAQGVRERDQARAAQPRAIGSNQ